MDGIFVMFAISDDIIKKLEALPKEDRKDFVLGLTDDDYFGKNFTAIEELNEHWKIIFQFFKEAKEINLDLIGNGHKLNPDDDECMLLLEKKDYLNTIIDRLGYMDPIQQTKSYLKMINHYDIGNHQLRWDDYTYYIEAIKNLSLKALYENGSVLFSLEPYR